METKKIKKLVIKKETISALNDYQLSKHKGGREEESGLSPCYSIYDDAGCPDYSDTCFLNCVTQSCIVC